MVLVLSCLLTATVPRRAPTPSGAVMWQEARKHERKLRGMMVDYKRRGERRREYYEKIVSHPAHCFALLFLCTARYT